MPGYATVADVENLNSGRGLYGQSTKPNVTQVVDWLEQTAAVLDSILLNRGYTVPVPTSASYAWKLLEGYNAIGAHAMVEQGAQASDRRDEAMAMWEAAQKMLKDGVIELPDAPQDTSETSPRAPSAPTPFFTREMVL